MRRLLIPPTLAPVGRDGVPAGPIGTLAGRTMGTTWSVRFVEAPGLERDDLHRRILVELARLVAQLSHWEPDSALCRFNRAPAGSRHRLPDALFTVLAATCAVAERTGGACDPTLGALVDLWGFGPPGGIARPPTSDAVAAARALCGWQRLALDPETRTALQPGGLQLDLSAIAKGYAVDCVSDLLLGAGVAHHLVEIGGELRGAGLKPGREPWWVALEAPPASPAAETVVALHDLSVATSGEYRRYVDLAGRRLGHSLDPATGEPIANAAFAATVLHASCMLADAYATALLVLGPGRGLELAAEAGLAARILSVEASGAREATSPAFDRLLA